MPLTPAERAALELRADDLKERIDELTPTLNSATAQEWIALWQDREGILKRLAHDGWTPGGLLQ
jgi:hypothetical protein